MSQAYYLRHARLMQEMAKAGVTVEDLARAWASIDGRRDEFDAGADKSLADDETGHFTGYVIETEETITRATNYARARKST